MNNALLIRKLIERVIGELKSSNHFPSDADWYIGFKPDQNTANENEYDPKTGKLIKNTEIGDYTTYLQQWDADNTGYLEEDEPRDNGIGYQRLAAPITEYSDKIINQLIDKFKQENPELDDNEMKEYINRFSQIKDSPRVTEKDITKYSWKDLETTVDANQPKRIKAGKINDGEPKDANLVYNQNGLRIYVGKTKQACIKYGNGYSFCISARGGENAYGQYRYDERGTPYFIFNDRKSSKRRENGTFVDPEHLLVLFVLEEPQLGYSGGNYDVKNPPVYYTITTANNDGDTEYNAFDDPKTVSVVDDYPELKGKGLDNIFKLVAGDPVEELEYKLQKDYDKIVSAINKDYSGQFDPGLRFEDIDEASKADELLKGTVEVYKFFGGMKQGVGGQFSGTRANEYVFVKPGQLDQAYQTFLKDRIVAKYFGSETDFKKIVSKWVTNTTKIDVEEGPYHEYLLKIKDALDGYRKGLAKLKLAK